jgi:hypothetical protein
VSDESSESDGLLTRPIGLRGDPNFEPSRPGRYLLRVRLSDNGNGVLADVLAGDPLALQLQANISGGDRPVGAAAERAPAPVTSRGRATDVLVAVIVGCLALGAFLTMWAARLRRSR